MDIDFDYLSKKTKQKKQSLRKPSLYKTIQMKTQDNICLMRDTTIIVSVNCYVFHHLKKNIVKQAFSLN